MGMLRKRTAIIFVSLQFLSLKSTPPHLVASVLHIHSSLRAAITDPWGDKLDK